MPFTSSAVTSVPFAPPSNELTYEAYRSFRLDNPGPTSNSSYKRWVKFGGEDEPSFKWHPYPSNRGPGRSSIGGNRVRRGGRDKRGGRGKPVERNGGGFMGNFFVNNY
ncbi:uncharacterized protein LOC136072870 [Hydra vulgaris]|uniref:uncharacterized protein LOC136072870 n=1 Tax=Hydra vulgaris TaxID=6087 RepID=UPI0032EA75D3